jgi:hypothetical protein
MQDAKRDPARELARRNRRTALLLAAIAIGFAVAFAWTQAHR